MIDETLSIVGAAGGEGQCWRLPKRKAVGDTAPNIHIRQVINGCIRFTEYVRLL